MELGAKPITMSILLLFFLFSTVYCKMQGGVRIELSHIDSKGNFNRTELVRRATARTMHRLARITAMQSFASTNITSPMHSGGVSIGEYLMELAIGTPPLPYSAIADTGSDLIWTQCNPCIECFSQPTPIFDPSNSSTDFAIPCNSTVYVNLCRDRNPPPECFCSYNYTYGTGWTSGTLDEETFTFGTTNPVEVSNITFGCSTSSSNDFTGTSGLVGLGRGELSLVSQLGIGKFSYCLTSFLDTNSTSPLLLGPFATLNEAVVNSTPFVKNPNFIPMNTFYYLSLKGISIGTQELPIPPTTFELSSNGTGGIIIDSGTTYTSLVSIAYQAIINTIKSMVTLRTANGAQLELDLCFSLPSGSSPPSMPDMIFHFDGADMSIPVDNYMFSDQDLWCLAMSSSEGISIFGNYQQQNMHVLYDLDNGVLSFAPAQCNKL